MSDTELLKQAVSVGSVGGAVAAEKAKYQNLCCCICYGKSQTERYFPITMKGGSL